MMIRHEIVKKITSIPRGLFFMRSSSSQVDIEKIERESLTQSDFIDEESKRKEEEIESKRNKSRLRRHDRSILMDKNPYPEPRFWHHGTLKYLRRTYGRYGEASGIDPSICWPIKQELDDVKEYERVKYPFSIPQMVADAQQTRKVKEERKAARQKEIIEKMEKLEGWKKELYEKIAKKESEAKAAKARKEKLIEEVKQHFGYTVDPKDEKFKELLEKKEKEQKKTMKEERRKAKEAKMLDKLLKKKEPVDTEKADTQNVTNVKDE
ncbi:growth arrest and DNA damage-inducible proteins-interacting protein CRIF [Leptinotarsa decemlineata]|uniref:growth arrest and DNA damage-inducible proteins-interacting protein CRIF n=1 Tax=Leptinotarsa decemlineata TaxID=7539 RepID=UPI000C255426|nr:growth arrest and DNA damage-inducible proteins-interacting protein 1 [Leptinotarsa decemlineata]